MTTQKKKPVAKTTTKKSTSSITDKELGTILTETLAKVAEPEPAIAQPQPVKIDGHDKTAFMVVMLSRPEGATLKEMAEALGWKENSIRGAMSLYAKKTTLLCSAGVRLMVSTTATVSSLSLLALVMLFTSSRSLGLRTM